MPLLFACRALRRLAKYSGAMSILLLAALYPSPVSAQGAPASAGIVVEGDKARWETPLDSATGLAIPCSQVTSRVFVEGAAVSRSVAVQPVPASFPDLSSRIFVEGAAVTARQYISVSPKLVEDTAGVGPRIVIEDAGAGTLTAGLSIERGPTSARVEDRILVENAAASQTRATAAPAPSPPPVPAPPAQVAPSEQPTPRDQSQPAVPAPQVPPVQKPLRPWLLLGVASGIVGVLAVALVVRHRRGLRRRPPGDTDGSCPSD
jgi:hypothetical protein